MPRLPMPALSLPRLPHSRLPLSRLSLSRPSIRARALRRVRHLFSLAAFLPLAACGTSDVDAAEPTGPGTPGGGAFPTELVGTWVYGVISPTNVVDAYNGSWIDSAYGTSVLFEFGPNGTYRQAILIMTRAYNCKSQVFVYNEGRAVVEGSTIKVYPTKGSVKARDTCVAANNFDRADNIAAKQGDTYGWTFKLHDDGKTYLLIGVRNDMTNPSYFRRS